MRHTRDVHTLAGPYALDAISVPIGPHLTLTAEPSAGTSRPTGPMTLNVVL